MPRLRSLVLLLVLGRSAVAAADPILNFETLDGFNVPVGTIYRMRDGIDNFGDTALTVTRLEITGPDAARFQFANAAAPACTGGQICDQPFSVDSFGFVETAITCAVDWPQLYRATVTITSNDPNRPSSSWSIVCDGAGPHIDFSQRVITFPPTRVGYWSVPQTVQITEGAGMPYRPGPAADFASSLDDVDCTDGCFVPGSVSIAFRPRLTGELHEQLVFQTEDGNIGIELIGTATGPTLTLETPVSQELGFGSARLGEATSPGTIRIRNTGDDVLHIASLVASGAAESAAFSITAGSTGPLDVAPNATAEWQVICRPIRVGDNFTWLYIESDSAFPETTVALDCGGDSGSLALDTGSPGLPPTALGSTSTVPMIARNVGNLPITITAIASDDAQFTAAPHGGTFPLALAPNATATVDLRFTPIRPGEQRATLTFSSDGEAFSTVASSFGLSQRVDLDPAAPALGNIPVGMTGEVAVKLGNDSDQTVVLQSITIDDPAHFAISDLQLIGATLQPTEIFPFTIRATPTAPGPLDTTITFAFDRGPATAVRVTANGAVPTLAAATWDGTPLDGVLDFGPVVTGSDSASLVSVTNTGTATLRIASCNTTGDAAFTVTTPCAIELAPGASADLAIGFAPTTAGPHSATLQLTSDATDPMLALTLTGTATPASHGGCAVGGDAGGLVLLAVALIAARRRGRARALGGPGQAARAAGAAAIAALVAGCGMPGPGDTAVDRGGTVTVTRTGTGDGTITSLTPGIDCGQHCSAPFDDAIHLAAAAAPGSTFTGWDGPCTGTGPCVVRAADAPAEVIARFDRHVQLTVTGDAPVAPFSGEITIDGVRCALPCVRSVLPGTTVTLDVFTLSTFTGWTGGCTPAPAPCRLTVTDDVQLVAHFATPDEQWTVIEDLVPDHVTVAGDEPVTAGVDGHDVVVTRYTSAGARAWVTRLPAGPSAQVFGLDHDAGGQVYVLAHIDVTGSDFGALLLHKLDGGGQPVWSRTLDDAVSVSTDAGDVPEVRRRDVDGLAVAPDGDAVVVAYGPTGAFVRTYGDGGDVRWTRPLPIFPLDLSIGGDGVITVAGAGGLTPGAVVRVDASGTVVGRYDLPDIPSENPPEFFYQAFALVGDQLVCQSANDRGFFTVVRAVDAATGAMTWSLDALSDIFGPVALGKDGLGNLVMIDTDATVHKLTGRSILWRRAPSHVLTPGNAYDAPSGLGISGDTHGRVIEVGAWLRSCAPGDRCNDDGIHATGFVRSYAP